MRPSGSGPQPLSFDPGGPPPAPIGGISRRTWLRRLYMTLRTEHRTPGKVGAGVGVGVFVGCSPLWGIHFAVAYLLARLFRLNRMLVYAAAYIGNPLTVGPILFSEVQIGHILLHGSWLPITLAEVQSLGFWGIFTDLMIGSLVFGLALGIAARRGRVADRAREQPPRDLPRDRRCGGRSLRGRFDPRCRGGAQASAQGSDVSVPDRRDGLGRGAAGARPGMRARRDRRACSACSPGRRSPAGTWAWTAATVTCARRVRRSKTSPGARPSTLDLRDFDPPPADVVVLNDVLALPALRLAGCAPPSARARASSGGADLRPGEGRRGGLALRLLRVHRREQDPPPGASPRRHALPPRPEIFETPSSRRASACATGRAHGRRPRCGAWWKRCGAPQRSARPDAGADDLAPRRPGGLGDPHRRRSGLRPGRGPRSREGLRLESRRRPPAARAVPGAAGRAAGHPGTGIRGRGRSDRRSRHRRAAGRPRDGDRGRRRAGGKAPRPRAALPAAFRPA